MRTTIYAVMSSLIILATALPAHSGVLVTIGPVADKNKYFLIKTGYNSPKLDGSSSAYLDTRLIQSPGPHTIPVNFYNPFMFNYVYATVYHPAYIMETKSSKKMPSLLKTVSLEKFNPRQWQNLIKSGEKIQKAGFNVKVRDVITHLQLFVEWYMPAADDEGEKIDLCSYIPLFEELVAYTKETSPLTKYNDASIDAKIIGDPEYAKLMQAAEQKDLMKLDEYLKEIVSLLSLSTEKRVKLRWMQSNIFKTKVIYHNLMTDKDRQTIEEFLEHQYRERNAHRRFDTLRNWTNKENNITYSVRIGNVYQSETEKGSGAYQECVESTINVDLTSAVEAPLKNLTKDDRANFCRGKQGWQLSLIGAENW